MYYIICILFNFIFWPINAINNDINQIVSKASDINVRLNTVHKHSISSLEDKIKTFMTPIHLANQLSNQELLWSDPYESDIYLHLSKSILPNKSLNFELDVSYIIQNLLYIGDSYKSTYIFLIPINHSKNILLLSHGTNSLEKTHELLPILMKMIQGKITTKEENKILHAYRRDLKALLNYRKYSTEALKEHIIRFVKKYINPYSGDFFYTMEESRNLGFY